jgi:acetyl-CoA carboxylase alpha subunit
MLDAVDEELRRLDEQPPDELIESRYRKFRRIGAWEDSIQTPVTAAVP